MIVTIDFLYGLLVGVALALFLWIAISIFSWTGTGTDVYGLQHWKLNVQLPPESMWMNLGYWHHASETPPQQFRDACTALLHELLYASGILEKTRTATKTNNASIAILDLGFGCGDQTLELVRLAQDRLSHNISYVGLTLNAAQAKLASNNLARQMAASGPDSTALTHQFRLLCADAANPKCWSPEVQEAVEALGSKEGSERWLLALDCLYHFSPSRRPIFGFVGSARGPFHANIMAFDLLISDDATFSQRMAVRIIGRLMGCPFNAFLTEECYRRELVEAGYPMEGIVVQDVTENVFPGLVAFLERQQALLNQHGLSLGRLAIAKTVFEWFHTSKALRVAIIIARKDS